MIKFFGTLSLVFSLIFLTVCEEAQVKQDAELIQKVSQDVEQFCTLIEQKYVYYQDRSVHWKQACDLAHGDANNLQTSNQALPIFERLVDELFDPHINLGRNSSASPWLIPSGSDIRVQMDGDNARIISVRKDGAADNNGLRVGMVITKINGKTPKVAALERIRAGRENISPERMDWAITAAVTGHRNLDRYLVVATEQESKQIMLGAPSPASKPDPLSWKMLDENIGYIRFNNSLGSSETVDAFDQAFEGLKQAKAWVLDLRDTPSGGNTGVAEPIIGRFISKKIPYQKIVPIDEASYNRTVAPRGPWTTDKPLIVLVGAWTGSMGEGMAIGFDGMKRGKVIGTKMAGLAGGTDGFTLGNTQIPVWFPTYNLAHLDGTNRHNWKPRYEIDSDPGGDEDLALQMALELFNKGFNF